MPKGSGRSVLPEIRLVGKNWEKVLNLTTQDRATWRDHFRRIIKVEARFWRDTVVKRLESGTNAKPPSSSTRITRGLHNDFSGYRIQNLGKPLIASGTMLNFLKSNAAFIESTTPLGDPSIFVGFPKGVRRGTKPDPSLELWKLAATHEFGGRRSRFLLRTKRGQQMLKFLNPLYEAGGLRMDLRFVEKTGRIVIRRRRRPFLFPAFREAKRQMKTRLNKQVAQVLREMAQTRASNARARAAMAKLQKAKGRR